MPSPAWARPRNARFVAGGTTLLDLMKLGVETPDLLIDINHIGLDQITLDEHGLHIGAHVSNTDLAEHEVVKEKWPVLSQAILAGASTQLRNMASVGGNLLQGNRCGYFRDVAMPCNRREPGTGCGALGEQPGVEGINRYCAVLGTSPSCIAAHPSDMCVALVAVDAVVKISNPSFDRLERIEDFFRQPGDTPNIQTRLGPDELITGIELPHLPPGARSMYLKVRDRTSYAYALTSAAVALTQDAEGRIDHIRVAIGRCRIGSLALARGGKRTASQPADRGGVPGSRGGGFRGCGPLSIQRLQDRAGQGHAGPGPERTRPSRAGSGAPATSAGELP